MFSGGQDSTTCLFWALKNFDEVIAVTFDYGQRHKLEIECAKEIAAELNVEHHILDMGLLNQLAPNGLRLHSLATFMFTVMAGVVCHIICKWLDSNIRR